ncbi:unnamed protein product [Vicia faba]|uniref:Uncharacterized protein n=1 Tax=Vicia faba TaxID=3906 RepID=A0AAV0Z813_VICFA|nr:unnamed protein product [Vicia faba]
MSTSTSLSRKIPSLGLMFRNCWRRSINKGSQILLSNFRSTSRLSSTIYVRKFSLRKIMIPKFNKKKGEMVREWDLSEAFETQVNELEAQLQENKDKMASFNFQVYNYHIQIIKLNKEITDLEKHKIELGKSLSHFALGRKSINKQTKEFNML